MIRGDMNDRNWLVGRTLNDRFRIDGILGFGGFGTVYDAFDIVLRRPVAVKVLMPPRADPAAVHALFQREAILSAQPQHANVVHVHDAGSDEKLRVDFLVMERLVGCNLAQFLSRGQLSYPIALSLLSQAAAGLAAGHRANLIHRDIKPGNLFVSENQAIHLHVLDFGIARWVDQDTGKTNYPAYVGPHTPRYASPEQIRGERLTTASDVYSLGLVGVELLGGKIARAATDSDDVREAVLGTLPPAVPPAVRAVLRRALAPAVRDRFRDAGEFLAALNSAISPVPPTPPRRRSLASWGVGAVAVTAVVALAWLQIDSRPPAGAADASLQEQVQAPQLSPGTRLIAESNDPEVRSMGQDVYALALPDALWQAVDAFLRPRPDLRMADWSDASPDGIAAMAEGRLQHPFALWRDLDGDGDLDVTLVFVSSGTTNDWNWRDWHVVVFRGWPDGHFDDVSVTTMNGSCFDGMIYVSEFRHVEYGCFEVAVGAFSSNGRGFSVETAMGD